MVRDPVFHRSRHVFELSPEQRVDQLHHPDAPRSGRHYVSQFFHRGERVRDGDREAAGEQERLIVFGIADTDRQFRRDPEHFQRPKEASRFGDVRRQRHD